MHRNTVLAAFADLSAEGWIRSTDGIGTFVANELPALTTPKARASKRRTAGFPIPPLPIEEERFERGGGKVLDWGVPDMRLFPAAALSRAYRDVLKRPAMDVLQYSRLPSPLHAPIARVLSDTRSFALQDPNAELLITRGSQMALYLAARVILRPGDAVAVEDPGYDAAWQAFRAAGAEVLGIGVDEQGLSIDALRQTLAERPIRAVFVTPHRQYPTTATLSAPRRIELLRLAKEHRFAIIEDDCDYEFHYDGGAVLPLASDDRAGVVVYVGSLSKVLAPGLRIGYLVGPESLIRQADLLRKAIDLQGDRALELAVAQMLEEGEVERHVRRSRRVYRARRDALVDCLRHHLSDVIDVEVPTGGLALWLRVRPSVDVEAWAEKALKQGLLFRTGGSFSLTGNKLATLRLGFGHQTEEEMVRSILRLKEALP